MDQVGNCLRHRKLTETAAKTIARQLRNRKRFKGLGAYPCKEGGEKHWHVGRAGRR